MTNSLADFFVRRTGRLYFNINSIQKYKHLILEDCIQHLDWEEQRVKDEKAALEMLLKDATTYYNHEFE